MPLFGVDFRWFFLAQEPIEPPPCSSLCIQSSLRILHSCQSHQYAEDMSTHDPKIWAHMIGKPKVLHSRVTTNISRFKIRRPVLSRILEKFSCQTSPACNVYDSLLGRVYCGYSLLFLICTCIADDRERLLQGNRPHVQFIVMPPRHDISFHPISFPIGLCHHEHVRHCHENVECGGQG